MTGVGIGDLAAWKRQGKRFAALTAYDAPSARILAAAGIPLILVGDSVGNVVLGYRDTAPVTMDEMLHHTRAVRRGAPGAFIVGDMPFLSYQVSDADAVANAGRFIKEGGADAVKLEGGRARASTVRALASAGVPVMGHLGLTPQSATLLGGHRLQAKDAESARRLLDDARLLCEAGIFALVLECVPEEVARAVTAAVPVPTIGIGAGPGCDGQILVLHDLLGIEGGYKARFVRRYAELEKTIGDAVRRFAADVERGDFPNAEESFPMPAAELERFRAPNAGRGRES